MISPWRGMDLMQAVCEAWEITPEDLRGPSRLGYLCDARRALCVLLRRAGWTYPRIAEFVNRDHTTVMHHVKRPLSDADEALLAELVERAAPRRAA